MRSLKKKDRPTSTHLMEWNSCSACHSSFSTWASLPAAWSPTLSLSQNEVCYHVWCSTSTDGTKPTRSMVVTSDQWIDFCTEDQVMFKVASKRDGFEHRNHELGGPAWWDLLEKGVGKTEDIVKSRGTGPEVQTIKNWIPLSHRNRWSSFSIPILTSCPRPD